MRDDEIDRLIEASSLGTPAAKAARETVSDEEVQRILDRVNASPVCEHCPHCVHNGMCGKRIEVNTYCGCTGKPRGTPGDMRRRRKSRP